MLKPSLLALPLAVLSPLLSAQDVGRKGVKVLEPQAPGKTASAAALDTEHFEAELFAGLLSVEDFNTNPVQGIAGRYYVNQTWFVEGRYGTSKTKRSNLERLEAGNFIPDRNFEFTSVAAGYQLLKGRSFWGKKHKYNASLYLIGGAESVDFAGNSETGFVIGLSHRSVLTDWLSMSIDFRDHIVNREITNINEDSRLTHNTEFSVSFSTFF